MKFTTPIFKLAIILIIALTTKNIYTEPINIIAYPNPYDPNSSNAPVTFGKKNAEGTPPEGFLGEVRIVIYNSILTKVFEKVVSKGEKVTWRAINSSGEVVPPGLYYVRLLENREDDHSVSEFFKLIIQ